jgi:hypothetical protein
LEQPERAVIATVQKSAALKKVAMKGVAIKVERSKLVLPVRPDFIENAPVSHCGRI